MKTTREPEARAWRLRILAAGLLVVSASTASGWLVGDLSEHARPVPPDYMLRPIAIAPAMAWAIGIASVTLTAICLATLYAASPAGRSQWLGVAGAVLLASVIIGGGYRVITAGVGGANIGGGLAVIFGGPLVVGLLSAAFVSGYRLRRKVGDL
jgi:hypothetical protein